MCGRRLHVWASLACVGVDERVCWKCAPKNQDDCANQNRNRNQNKHLPCGAEVAHWVHRGLDWCSVCHGGYQVVRLCCTPTWILVERCSCGFAQQQGFGRVMQLWFCSKTWIKSSWSFKEPCLRESQAPRSHDDNDSDTTSTR
jgi:hypothetical protein